MFCCHIPRFGMRDMTGMLLCCPQGLGDSKLGSIDMLKRAFRFTTSHHITQQEHGVNHRDVVLITRSEGSNRVPLIRLSCSTHFSAELIGVLDANHDLYKRWNLSGYLRRPVECQLLSRELGSLLRFRDYQWTGYLRLLQRL